MPTFQEGQEVEVHARADGFSSPNLPFTSCRKAKIVAQYAARTAKATASRPRWHVQFPDGARAVFDAEHIRAVGAAPDIEFRDKPYDEYGWNERQERRGTS